MLPPLAVVQAQLDAYNAKDIDALLGVISLSVQKTRLRATG
ncbi:hypothetical protein [Acidovorax sp. GW101-3H11]|nr:hypothetical protein [Acidovorax sp. GW101-3H11]